MAKGNGLNFHLPSADDLFSTEAEREDAKLKRIYDIPLDQIDDFPKHPFQVNAAAFIAIHNHPSGNITPSAEDKEVTERLMACGEFLDIKMLDHIIVAGETGKMLSMKSEGLMPTIPGRDMER